ncbi:MAG: sulfatase activating formylglycine-generating enzyme [Candidatus Endobugula sp.]|jgi:formylglycine-generating enzyme required for sulfatase activity
MNEFDKTIQSARKKRFLQYSIIGSLVAIGLFVYLSWLFLAKGYVMTILPAEAQASATVNARQGQGFYISDVLYLLTAQATVDVSADGFETATLRITDTSETKISVSLTPSPGMLVATTQPDLPETEWSISNALVHIGETLEQPLPPGEHTLLVQHKYYQPIEETLLIERQQKQEKSWQLTPVNGQLIIDSSPISANVIINGEDMGKTPINMEKPAGAYAIEISAEGYDTIEERAEITYKKPQIKRQYQLALRKGSVSLTLSPVGGELFIDGVLVNTDNASAKTIALSANETHRIRYQLAGYADYQEQVKVAPDENKALSISLQKTFGTITVATKPAATIRLNGNVVGQSFFKQKLSTVPHQFTFSRDGYRSQTQMITPINNQTKTVNVRLLSEFDARRKEGKPLFVSTLGIKLKSVSLDGFTMGSPPNEKGRQRNEFPIRVDFTRRIWVSQHEITEAQYSALNTSKPNTSLPVSDVTWTEAVRYCNWLSEQEGLPAFYTIQNRRVTGFDAASTGYRLLSEAEWEWLAKKAKRSSPTMYIWGNSERMPKKAGNIADKSLSSATFYIRDYSDGFSGKAPVGSFKADRSGLYDMLGNVSEWVHDNYTNTPPSQPQFVDYMGATRGVGHIVKGANYSSGRFAELRGAYKQVSENKAATIGFRISRYAK